MAQARGYQSRLVVDFEDTFGADPGAPAGLILPINSFGVNSSRPKNTAQTITGNRNPVEPFDGNTTVSGSATIPVDATAMGYWLYAMFGAPTTTGAGPYEHVFKVGNTQPSMVMEKLFGTATATYAKMNGCKVGSFSLSVGGDGELTANMNIEGANETVSTTAYDASPTTVNLDRFQMFQANLQEGGMDISSITQMSLDINFGLDTSQYTIGGNGKRGDIPEGIMSVSGSLTSLFEDLTLLNKAINSTETSLQLKFTNGTDVLQFDFGEVQLQQQTPGINGPAGVSVDLPWTAYYDDDADASAVKVTLTNGVTSYPA